MTTPQRGHLPFDGRSLVPLIRQPDADTPDRTIIMHSQNVIPQPVKWRNSVVMTERWRLINGKELYDIQADLGQEKNIAQQHPNIVAQLRQRYEKHWADLRMADYPYPRPIVGSEYEAETWLNCDAWIRDHSGPHTWNQSHVRAAAKNSGFWPIEIARPGTYRFDVRRWPKPVNVPITAPLPPQAESDINSKGKPVRLGPGKAIPAVKVKLRVGDTVVEKKLNNTDISAVFDLKLPAGPTEVRAQLIDKNNKSICVAYYVYIYRLN